MSTIGDNIRSLRKQAHLTQAELATRLGVSGSAVGMYERGERRPDFELTEKIADFFSVDLNYLIGSSHNVTRLTDSTDDDAVNSDTYVLLDFEERCVVKKYRHASEDTRAAVRAVLGISGGDKK